VASCDESSVKTLTSNVPASPVQSHDPNLGWSSRSRNKLTRLSLRLVGSVPPYTSSASGIPADRSPLALAFKRYALGQLFRHWSYAIEPFPEVSTLVRAVILHERWSSDIRSYWRQARLLRNSVAENSTSGCRAEKVSPLSPCPLR